MASGDWRTSTRPRVLPGAAFALGWAHGSAEAILAGGRPDESPTRTWSLCSRSGDGSDRTSGLRSSTWRSSWPPGSEHQQRRAIEPARISTNGRRALITLAFAAALVVAFGLSVPVGVSFAIVVVTVSARPIVPSLLCSCASGWATGCTAGALGVVVGAAGDT